jgi:hypothetical protein
MKKFFGRKKALSSREIDQMLPKYRTPTHPAEIELDDLEFIESIEDEIDLREAKRVLETLEEDGTIPFSELKKELDL